MNIGMYISSVVCRERGGLKRYPHRRSLRTYVG